MSGPQRAPDQTAISVSIGKELLGKIDARAEALGLSRSQYLANLARTDVVRGGDMILKESANSAPAGDAGTVHTATHKAVALLQAAATPAAPPPTKAVSYRKAPPAARKAKDR